MPLVPLVYRTAIYQGSADRGRFAGVTRQVGVGQPTLAVFIRSWCSQRGNKLKRLAERFLRLVMLVAVPFGKPVGPLADHIRSHIHPAATPPSRPLLGGFQKFRSRSCAALAFRHDQTVYFCPDIALHLIRNAYITPSYH